MHTYFEISFALWNLDYFKCTRFFSFWVSKCHQKRVSYGQNLVQ